MKTIEHGTVLHQTSLSNEECRGYLWGVVEFIRLDVFKTIVYINWYICGCERSIKRSYTFSNKDWVSEATFIHRLA